MAEKILSLNFVLMLVCCHSLRSLLKSFLAKESFWLMCARVWAELCSRIPRYVIEVAVLTNCGASGVWS